MSLSKNQRLLIAGMVLSSLLLPIPSLAVVIIGALIAQVRKIKFTKNQWIVIILISALSTAFPLLYEYGTGYLDVYVYDTNTKAPLKDIPVWVKCPSAGISYYSDGWKAKTGSTGRVTFRELPAGETCYYWVNPWGLTAYEDGGEHFFSLVSGMGKKRTHYLEPKRPTCIPGQEKCSDNIIHKCYKEGSTYRWKAITNCGGKGCVCVGSKCHCEMEVECRSDSDCLGKVSPTPYGNWGCINNKCVWHKTEPECRSNDECKDADPCTKDFCSASGVCKHIRSPDSDADGVCDMMDKCKYEPGFPPDGCPKKECVRDTDCRSSDPCQKGRCMNHKCIYTFQDRDGDGTCDYYDKCPREYGVPEHHGCPAPSVTTTTTTTTTTLPPGVTTTTTTLPPTTTTFYISPAFCTSDAECDDNDPCTLDKCVNGECTHIFRDKDDDGICDAKDECPEEYGVKEYKGCPAPAPPWIWIGVGVAVIAILFMFAMRGRERIVYVPPR